MPTTIARRPEATEHVPYYGRYIDLNTESDAVEALARSLDELLPFFASIPEAKAGYRYAPGKWSIREVVGHLIDSERVFTYRATRFARADETPLAGFDETRYVPAAKFDRIPLTDLVTELELVLRAGILFFRGLDDDAWSRGGKANDNFVTVRALAWIIAGHGRHHVGIVRSRYLEPARA